MKKINKKLLLFSIIIVAIILSAIKLYSTYATGESQDPDVTFNFTLDGDTIVNIPGYSVKTVFYQTTNTTNGTIKYGVGYNTTNNDVNVKVYADSDYNYTGLINEGVTKTIKLRIENYSDEDAMVELKTVLGYETGGDLIVPQEIRMVDSTFISEPMVNPSNNGSYFYVNNLTRANIESIEYTTLSNMPNNVTTIDISQNNDNSVRLWYELDEDTNLYKVYIGTLSGKIKMPSNSTGMKNMFSNLTNVTSLDLSMFDTSEVKSMDYMFYYSSKLESIDLSSFDTSSVTNMSQMFRGCNKLSELNITNFDTSSVQDMSYMFNDCKALTTINLGKFNTSDVKYMQYMFASSNNITSLDLSNFDTSSALQMNYMFHGLTKLSKLDISNFTFSNVNNYIGMFNNIPSVADIIVKDCTQYNLVTTGTGRTAGIRTVAGLSTECTSS